jgi:hypothetical protein
MKFFTLGLLASFGQLSTDPGGPSPVRARSKRYYRLWDFQDRVTNGTDFITCRER